MASSAFNDTFNNRSMCSTDAQRHFEEMQLPGSSQQVHVGFNQSMSAS